MKGIRFTYTNLFFIFILSLIVHTPCLGNNSVDHITNSKMVSDSLTKKVKVDSTSKEGWNIDGSLVLNISNTYLENWKSGGDNTFAANSTDMMTVNYKTKKLEWENTVKVAGGFLQYEGGDYMKTDDRIEITTKYGKKSKKYWNYSGQVGFQTQFFPGYLNKSDTIKRSDFMAPGYITISLGMDYKRIKQLTIMMSPLAGKITILNSNFISNYDPDDGAYGVKPGENARYEMGGTVEIQAKGDYKKLNYYSDLKSFLNYIDKPQNIDLSWEVILGYKLNKFFTANLKTYLVYDDDALKRIQFKELFGLGFAYKI
jgi:hypothetical protein